MDLLTRMNRVAFLGPEFLSWLWYRTENQGPEFSVEGVEGALEIWFDDRLIVGSTLVNAQENHFQGGHPTTSLEARSALRLGKLATEARLRIVHGSREWSFILKGADLSLNGVKIPSVLSKDDEERLYERLYLLEELDRMVWCLRSVPQIERLGRLGSRLNSPPLGLGSVDMISSLHQNPVSVRDPSALLNLHCEAMRHGMRVFHPGKTPWGIHLECGLCRNHGRWFGHTFLAPFKEKDAKTVPLHWYIEAIDRRDH